MNDLDQDRLRRLAAFTASEGRAVSLVLDLDPSTTGTVPALATRVNSLANEAERRARERAAGLGHDPRPELEAAGGRDRGYLEGDLDRSGARSLALYANGEDGELLDVRLTQPWPDELRVGTHFALAPLLPTLEWSREVVLAVVGRERGTIARLRHGRMEEIDDLSNEVHGQHSQGGWSQARYERSVDREAEEHYRDLADALGDLIAPGSQVLLAAACPEEQRSSFMEALPRHVQDAFLGWITAESHTEATALQDEVEALLEERLAEEARAELDRLGTASADGRAATGWGEVLPAAWEGRVNLLLVDGTTADAWECPQCGRGETAAGRCPIDSQVLEPVDGGALESAVRGTLAYGGTLRLVAAELMPGDAPSAALLRFADSPRERDEETR